MKTERQSWRQKSQTSLLKYSDLTETLEASTVLMNIQQINKALKAINNENEEGLISMIKKKSEILKK